MVVCIPYSIQSCMTFLDKVVEDSHWFTGKEWACNFLKRKSSSQEPEPGRCTQLFASTCFRVLWLRMLVTVYWSPKHPCGSYKNFPTQMYCLSCFLDWESLLKDQLIFYLCTVCQRYTSGVVVFYYMERHCSTDILL